MDSIPASAAAVSPLREDQVAFVRRMRARRDQGRRLRLVVWLGVVAGVVAVCGVGFQNFVVMGCRSKQSEAKGILKQVAVYEASVLDETGQYGPLIDLRTTGSKRRYVVVPGRVTATSFEVFALGIADVDFDLWRVTDSSPPEVVYDVCAR